MAVQKPAKIPAKPKKPQNKQELKKKVAIALQGGGAHGAFAWGVLDRLLEDGRFDIRGLSGTSAGGMNAAATVMGLLKGGPEGARETLFRYWKSISELSKQINPLATSDFDQMMDNPNLDSSPLFQITNFLQTYFSPYELNPMGYNAFHDFLKEFFDFKLMRSKTEPRLFLGATHVKTGKIKIFSNEELSADAMMASACLPFLFHATKVDGDYYWDGGYIANPAIFPLIHHTDSHDIILIQLRKTHCEKIPQTRAEILERFQEITYNSCLVREMRAIYFVTNLIDQGIVKEGMMKRINMHVIKNEAAFKDLNLSSAMNTNWNFLTSLFEKGRATADQWIKQNFDKVGVANSVDEEMFSDFVS